MMHNKVSVSAFDPNAAATDDSGIFGLPFREEDSQVVLLPVPWEVTTSYGGGTSRGPECILEASKQVDLFDLDVEKPYELGIYMREISQNVRDWNARGRALAEPVIAVAGNIESNQLLKESLSKVNELSGLLNSWVYDQTRELLDAGKIVGLVGGDHSTPFGAIRAHAERFSSFGLNSKAGFGVLHFDAHSDTRVAYEGFTHSHASIMYNVLEQIPEVSKLVQVGIRDVCEQEMEYIQSQGNRVRTYFDRDLAQSRFRGESFEGMANRIIQDLPQQVYVSFDIDGLDPRYCPNTGTPVPGGLDFAEATYILKLLVGSGRSIVGFDLNEVAPGPEGDEWDANCGARLLYKLISYTLASQGKRTLRFD